MAMRKRKSWRHVRGFSSKGYDFYFRKRIKAKARRYAVGLQKRQATFTWCRTLTWNMTRKIIPSLDGRADVVYGSRFLGGPQRVHFFWHYVGNKFLTLLSDVITNLNLTDMETCYKVFRREVIEGMRLKSNRFGFEPEVTVKIAKGKWRIYEVPISYSGRSYEDGKKITWRDGFVTLYAILRYRLFD